MSYINLRELFSITLMAVPVATTLHLSIPGEWLWYQELSVNVVSVMLSGAWWRIINLKNRN